MKQKLKETLDKEKLMSQVTEQAKKLRDATQDEKDILGRMADREKERRKATAPVNKSARQENETQREYLVRTGKITPFSHMPEATHRMKNYDTDATHNSIFPGSSQNDMTHKNLHAPSHQAESGSSTVKSTKRKLDNDDDDFYLKEEEDDDYKLEKEEEDTVALDSGDEELLLDTKTKRTTKKFDEIYDDDGSEANYQKRLQDWVYNRKIMRYQAEHVSFYL